MKYRKMKFFLPAGRLSAFALTVIVMFFTLSVSAGNKSKKDTPDSKKNEMFEVFSDQLPAGAQWKGGDQFVRNGGHTALGKSTHYIYVNSSDSPAQMTGLSIPIRENPRPGEYRYMSFAWVKWGGDQIGIQLGHKGAIDSSKRRGTKYNYTYVAGKGDIKNGMIIDDKAPGNWVVVTRDLWKDFGDFTLTGVSFICPVGRDAGFDAVFLGKTPKALASFAPGVIPTEVTEPVDVKGANMSLSQDSTSENQNQTQGGVQIDWAAQIKAGGFMMYPLYLLGLLAIVIALQRIVTSREARLAPKRLCTAVRDNLAKENINGAIKACDQYPSTLAESLRFILQHRGAGREAVSQTAGDIAARDIREHLSRIYPISIIASLSPLLGLLGTIVGMIQAFALVAMYGDQGGAAILSNSISKALITTAAGLIIAVPAIAVYYVIKKRITHMASLIEIEIENVITKLYLADDFAEVGPSKKKEEKHAPGI